MKKVFYFFYKITLLIVLVVLLFSFNHSSITFLSKTSNTNSNKNINLNSMAKVIENFAYNDKYTPLDTYYGYLTGYAANCALCSGKLGCNGQNVLDGTTTYNDKLYGTVRIVASSKNLACGSIVQFTSEINNKSEQITAIVLDRGVSGTALDLLVKSEDEALQQIGRKKISYNILRIGWNR